MLRGTCEVLLAHYAHSYLAPGEQAPRRAKKELPADEIVVSSTTAPADDAKPKKGGWWQRGFFGG